MEENIAPFNEFGIIVIKLEFGLTCLLLSIFKFFDVSLPPFPERFCEFRLLVLECTNPALGFETNGFAFLGSEFDIGEGRHDYFEFDLFLDGCTKLRGKKGGPFYGRDPKATPRRHPIIIAHM